MTSQTAMLDANPSKETKPILALGLFGRPTLHKPANRPEIQHDQAKAAA